MTNHQHTNSFDVYSLVTNRIIELLEKGIIPWRQPWNDTGIPKNLITGKNYRGINVWLLSSLNHPQNYFLTFKQVHDLGGSVKKGEKSQEVIFWKFLEKENPDSKSETDKLKKIPMLRYYRVFNIDQCEGIPKEKIPPVVEKNNNPIESCEKIISEMPKRPEIRHVQQQAFYNKTKDFVNMPKIETFETSESYYGTLFHELVHSVGHVDRLNRKELMNNKGFGTDNYAIEELTAEIGASYLKSFAGIPIEKLENNTAYIQSWLEQLKRDKRFIVYASSQAQKAVDFILNVRNEEREMDNDDQSESLEKSNKRESEIKKFRDKSKEEKLSLQI